MSDVPNTPRCELCREPMGILAFDLSYDGQPTISICLVCALKVEALIADGRPHRVVNGQLVPVQA